VCAASCGNGILETGEVCDDGNVEACGRCSFDCSALNSPVSGCPLNVTCGANADCASASCVSGTCAP
jgi:cysteine-rich repeat protein